MDAKRSARTKRCDIGIKALKRENIYDCQEHRLITHLLTEK